jgi:type IV pilus assembly protein PilE
MKTKRYGTVQPRGFTLIELMVVVAIVAILATIATASYRNYTMRATRTEGRIVLLAIQVAQEKFFLQNSQYAQSIATITADPPGGLGIRDINASGVTNGGHYSFTIAATANTYTLTATAIGSQATDSGCTVFTVNDQGQRTPLDSSGCWR